jgi:hypothetical protein
MTKQLRLWRRAAALVGATALVAAVAVVAPAASMAHSGVTKCANTRVTISPEAGHPIKYPVKAITTEGGVSCATAYKVIQGVLTGKPPAGWKGATASFEAPEGLIPQLVKKGSKKIKYAVQGG